MAALFPLEVAAQLDKPQGTVIFRYLLPKALYNPPADVVVLAEAHLGSVIARLELSPNYDLRFVRTHLEGGSHEASVNIRALRGVQAFQVYLVWSPDEVRVHIGPYDRSGPLLQST